VVETVAQLSVPDSELLHRSGCGIFRLQRPGQEKDAADWIWNKPDSLEYFLYPHGLSMIS
jgi:hypothetical protein